MSDISLNWGVLDYALIIAILCGPGAVLGLITGAALLPGHRIRGAIIGALEGFLVLLGYWHVHIGSNLSLSDGGAQAVLKSLAVAWPGVAIGGLAGALAFRTHRLAGIVAGAPAGFILGLYVWWLLIDR